jgi:hypothetical protein
MLRSKVSFGAIEQTKFRLPSSVYIGHIAVEKLNLSSRAIEHFQQLKLIGYAIGMINKTPAFNNNLQFKTPAFGIKNLTNNQKLVISN